MSSISSGTTLTTALVQTADTSGVLQLQTNGGTTALTLDTSQNATFAGKVASASSLQLATNGTTTAVTIDTSQNVGVGVTPSAWQSYLALQMNAGSILSYSTNDYRMVQNTLRTGGAWQYINNGFANAYLQNGSAGGHSWYIAPSGTAGNAITFTQAMTLDASGNLQLNQTGGISKLNITGDSTNKVITTASGLSVGSTAENFHGDVLICIADTAGYSTANTAMKLAKTSATGRSINAAGSINQNGSDYAEYMTKSGNFSINKGDICGIDVNGKLTNVFANAISFVVKSTDPGLVGGDNWHTQAGVEPDEPNPPVRGENESDADWVIAESNYQNALATYNAELTAYKNALEMARQTVDRIAFSGQVPVNVTGATAGQYIIPVANQDGSISGQAVSESAMTLQQYMQSVGKVISVVDNVTTSIVKGA